MKKIQLKIRDSAFDWIYNSLIYVFKEKVRAAMESNLSDAIVKRSAALLSVLNKAGQKYWPVLLRVAEKNVDKITTVTEQGGAYVEKMKQRVQTSEIARNVKKTLLASEDFQTAKDIVTRVTTSDAVRAANAIRKEATKSFVRALSLSLSPSSSSSSQRTHPRHLSPRRRRIFASPIARLVSPTETASSTCRPCLTRHTRSRSKPGRWD